MRKLILSLVLLSLVCGLAVFIAWAGQRPSAYYLSDLRNEILGVESPAPATANLLLIRPQLFALDYQSPDHLRLKLAAALEHARAAGLLRPGTLVALPEHIGTWLIARDEKVEFYRARTRKEVRDWLLLGNPWLAVKALLLNLDAQRLDEALLRMKAERMAEDYQQLFAGLAREYHVTLLAGSILLPEPRVENGRLHSGEGPLRNLSLVFASDGSLLGEPYSEPWPWRPNSDAPQRFMLDAQEWTVMRDWGPGYPQSVVQLPDGRRSAPLFLRGKLSWPIGGAPRSVELTPSRIPQASEAPGSHLLNLWLGPP